MKTGVLGWPILPNPKAIDGESLACPKCGSFNIRLGAVYAAIGSGPGGLGRLGDPGSGTLIQCLNCSHSDYKKD